MDEPEIFELDRLAADAERERTEHPDRFYQENENLSAQDEALIAAAWEDYKAASLTPIYLDRVVRAARHLCASYDEFGRDLGVLGHEIERLQAALDGDPMSLDEDSPR